MKNLFILLFCLSSFSVFSAEVDVLSAEFGVEDYTARKTLCLTVVRIPNTGAVMGVVESIEDCFFARQAKKSPNHKIDLPLKYLKKITDLKMRDHLQTLDAQLEFYFSDGE